jgi:predicted TIM-barrel fold metal-dependent hydrolase
MCLPGSTEADGVQPSDARVRTVDVTDSRSLTHSAPGPFAHDGLAGRVIDGCVFPAWPGTSTLANYMTEEWQELLVRPGDRAGPVSVLSPRLYQDPKRPTVSATASLIQHDLLAGGVRERIVLGWDDGLFSTAFPHQHLARRVVAAANDWLADQWLPRDPAFFGMLLVPSGMPMAAAAEIRRAGTYERIVAVALGCNSLARPFGDSIYLPIFEAAAEAGLPVVLQIGSDATTDLVTPPVAGGLPATYAEYRALGVHSHMSHVASMIVGGLFERLPSLRVLLIGGGFGWVPSWLWRLDAWMKQYRRTQAPWLTRLPSDYFAEHVRVTTDALDASGAEEWSLSGFRELDRNVIYASCYPSAEAEEPDAVAARLDGSWVEAVLRNTALDFYRWPHPDAGRSDNSESLAGSREGGPP